MNTWLRRMTLVAITAAMALPGCAGSGRPADPFAGLEDETDLRAALVTTRQEVALSPGEPYWPYRLATLQHRLGEAEEAEVAVGRALALDPYYVPALAFLSKLYFESARHEAAIEHLESLREMADRFAGGFPNELLAGLALHYDAVADLDAAAAIVETLRRSGVDWRRYGSTLTYVTLRGDSFEEAGPLAEASLESAPESAVNLNNVGITRLTTGDPAAARKAFLEAHTRDPKLPGPLYNLAIVDRFYLLDDESAAAWFSMYWRLSQEDPDGLAEIFQPNRTDHNDGAIGATWPPRGPLVAGRSAPEPESAASGQPREENTR